LGVGEFNSFCLTLINFYGLKEFSFFKGETDLVCLLLVDSLAFIIFFESVGDSFNEGLLPDKLKVADFAPYDFLLDVVDGLPF
jgi:hypothetical protein